MTFFRCTAALPACLAGFALGAMAFAGCSSAQPASAPTAAAAAASPDPFSYRAVVAGSPETSAKIVSSTDSASDTTYRLTYSYRAGEDVPALLVVPKSASKSKPAPALVIIHGLGGRKEAMLPVGRIAAQTGYASLIIDLPGYGDRAPANPPALISPGQITGYIADTVTRSVQDLGGGLNYLASRPEIDMGRVGVLGVSLGGIIGADWTAVEPRLKCAMLISAGGGLGDILTFEAVNHTSFGAQYAAAIRQAGPAALEQGLQAVDPVTYAPSIAPRSLLMENGDADNIIPPSAARMLFNAAKEPKHIDWYPGEGHIPSMLELYAALTAFLSKNLPVTTAPK